MTCEWGSRFPLDLGVNLVALVATHTCNTLRADTLIRIDIQKSDRRHGAAAPEELTLRRRLRLRRSNIRVRAPGALAGRHTNRITGCLLGFTLGIPFPPNGGEAPVGFSRITPFWFHEGYRPVG